MRYVCFLRGINVGGHKVILMENLKKMFESFGLKNVKTFIQSGNVLFDSPQNDRKKLAKKISYGLFKNTGYDIEVFVRDINTVKNILRDTPFPGIVPDKIIKIYITFLNEIPSEEKKNAIESMSYDAEKFIIRGEEVYMLINKERLGPKPLYSTNFVEKKLGLKGTSRDWGTLTKLINIE